jgi:hypothetical protein
MAAANCAKLRVTGESGLSGDAPELQTASFNGRVGEKGRRDYYI